MIVSFSAVMVCDVLRCWWRIFHAWSRTAEQILRWLRVSSLLDEREVAWFSSRVARVLHAYYLCFFPAIVATLLEFDDTF